MCKTSSIIWILQKKKIMAGIKSILLSCRHKQALSPSLFCKDPNYSIFLAHLKAHCHRIIDPFRLQGTSGSLYSRVNTEFRTRLLRVLSWKPPATERLHRLHCPRGTVSCSPYIQSEPLLFHLMLTVPYPPAMDHHEEPSSVSPVTL